MTSPKGRFSREVMKRYTVDRIRMHKYGSLGKLVDRKTGKLYAPGPPWYRVSDNETWRTLVVQAPNAPHARRAALEEAEKWGGWGDE